MDHGMVPETAKIRSHVGLSAPMNHIGLGHSRRGKSNPSTGKQRDIQMISVNEKKSKYISKIFVLK